MYLCFRTLSITSTEYEVTLPTEFQSYQFSWTFLIHLFDPVEGYQSVAATYRPLMVLVPNDAENRSIFPLTSAPAS
jgi:hypothetical protein